MDLSSQIESQERAEADLRAEIAAEAKANEKKDKVSGTAAGMDSDMFVIAVEDYATDILSGIWTMDQVPEEYKEAVRAELARRKAALKRA